jgi:hypothetical protein
MQTRLIGLALAGVLWAGVAEAQTPLDSNEVTATLTATLSESLTLQLSPSAVTFSLTGGSATNAGNTALSVTTAYTLSPSRTGLALYAYFTAAATALAHTDANNTVNIPSSRVQGSVNGGSSTAFTDTVAYGGAAAGLEMFSIVIDPSSAGGQRTDTLALNIDLSGYSLPADTYSGTLRIRAQATP